MHHDAHRPIATGGRRAFAILLSAMLLPVFSSATHATRLGLRFDDCIAGPAATAVRAHGCVFASPPIDLYASIELDASVDSVIAMEVVIDLQHANPSLPDWWRLDPAGCRAGRALASTDLTQAGDCADPWASDDAVAILQSIEVGQPRGAANQLRLVAAVGVPSDQATTLSAGTVLHALRLRIDGTPAGPVNPACGGCTGHACLVLNGVRLVRLPSAPDQVLSHTGAAGEDRVVWQGIGADCLAVHVRDMTWGRIKSLYHRVGSP